MWPSFIQNFNNRERAIGIWLILFVLWAIFKKETRESISHLIKSFFAWKLTVSYLAMLTYIATVLLILHHLHVWSFSQTTNTLLWIVFGAFSMILSHAKVNEDNYFIDTIKEHFRVLVIIEFMINFYVFSLPVELIVFPLLSLLGVMIVISEAKKEYEQARKLLNLINSTVGLYLLIHVFYMVITDFSNFAKYENLQTFIIPILLSILFLPFVYFMTLFINYETLFIRLSFVTKEKTILSYAKKMFIITFGISLKKLNKWSKEMNNYHFDSIESVDEALRCFTNKY